jgi:predicted DsbA family dithiol-disulfide isomerase
MGAFSGCFNGRQALERVLRDMYDAQGVIQQTPTFIVLVGGRGHVLKGSRPADQFAAILRTRLEGAQGGE